jgi:hypothetical protein
MLAPPIGQLTVGRGGQRAQSRRSPRRSRAQELGGDATLRSGVERSEIVCTVDATLIDGLPHGARRPAAAEHDIGGRQEARSSRRLRALHGAGQHQSRRLLTAGSLVRVQALEPGSSRVSHQPLPRAAVGPRRLQVLPPLLLEFARPLSVCGHGSRTPAYCPLMFASRTVTEHLARGFAGIGLLVLAFVMSRQHSLLALPLAALALLCLRGCPLCWTMGLMQTVSAKLRGGLRSKRCAYANPYRCR